MGVNANVTIQNGTQAATNVNVGGSFYGDPGNALTFALQSNTGVQQWVLTATSDYGPANGWTYTTSSLFSGVSFPTPQTPCKITFASEVTDGNNVTTSQFTVFSYARVTNPDRNVRCVIAANTNVSANGNSLVTQDGVTLSAGDRVLLVGQATLAQNGPYVVSAIASNVYTYSRPGDYATGQVLSGNAPIFEVAEGTLYAGTTWKALGSANGAATVDTTNLTFYPKTLLFSLTNIANSTTATANSFIWTGAACFCISKTTVNACKITTVNAGAGTGNVTAACANAADAGFLTVMNW